VQVLLPSIIIISGDDKLSVHPRDYPSTPETPVGATALANLGEYWQNLGKNLAKNLTGLGKKHVTWSVLTPRGLDIKKKFFFATRGDTMSSPSSPF
jgi:hypothetical protein